MWLISHEQDALHWVNGLPCNCAMCSWVLYRKEITNAPQGLNPGNVVPLQDLTHVASLIYCLGVNLRNRSFTWFTWGSLGEIKFARFQMFRVTMLVVCRHVLGEGLRIWKDTPRTLQGIPTVSSSLLQTCLWSCSSLLSFLPLYHCTCPIFCRFTSPYTLTGFHTVSICLWQIMSTPLIM